MAEIVLDRVTKSYPNGATAVKELSVTIADGEFIILVGPSGCGKSTTLNMIAGLEDISSGELRIGGDRVNEKAPKDRDIAMVFQSYALYPHMTVRQNIAFPLTLAKVKKDEIATKVEEAAKVLGLTELLDRKPGQLSGGQRQRVAMGRAIVRNPKAFLMDEPLSNLDAKLRVQMRSEIARLQSRLGTTTVYVTHDQTEAMTLGDRVVVLLGGVAQQIGSPEELYNRPANLFVAGFIGSPAMNFFPGTLTDVGVRIPMGEIMLTQEVQDLLAAHKRPNNVIVGIRPEHLEDADADRHLSADQGADLRGERRRRRIAWRREVCSFQDRRCRCAFGPAGGGGRNRGGRKRVRGTGFHRVEGDPGADDAARLRHVQDRDLRRRLGRQPDHSARRRQGTAAGERAGNAKRSFERVGVNERADATADRVTDVLAEVRAHLREHFARAGIIAEPDAASVTFLGTERIEVLRFGPDDDGVIHYVSLGCSRHPMFDPTEMVTDALHGPRAEVVVALRGPSPNGLARSLAILAAAPAVEGLMLEPDALVDLQTPLWDSTPFTAFLLGRSDIDDVPLPAPRPPVRVLSATPITGNEAAWVRLKGADAMRQAWAQDGVDVLDPSRSAARPS